MNAGLPAAAAGLLVVLAGAAALAASPSPTPSQSATATITYTPAVSGVMSVKKASMSPGTASEVATRAFAFKNADTTNGVTIMATGTNWTLSLKLAKSASGQATIPAGTGPFMYKAVGTDGASTLGGTSAGSGTATGTIDAGAASASSSSPASTPTKSSAKPTTAAGSASASKSAAEAASKAASSAAAGPRVAYPGGVLPSIAPGATVNGSVLPPQVAPYATSTAPNGSVTTLFSTFGPTATSDPAAVLSANGGGGGPSRSFGLPAAVTAVVLVGLLVTLFRLLLAHPAAGAVARRH